MNTPSIREKFEKAFEKAFQFKGRGDNTYYMGVAEWAFLEGMRVAREIVKDNKSISLAIKEFTDDPPK